MTAQVTFSLDTIDAALAAAGPSLGPDEQRRDHHLLPLRLALHRPATAQQWTAAHPGTFVISLGDAAELARHAARAFGARYATRPDGLTQEG